MRVRLAAGFCLSVLACGAATAATTDTAQSHSANTPKTRAEADIWWKGRHEKFNARARQGNVDLLFLGDSITEGWETFGKVAWAKHFAKRNAANMGISGDRTQNVLWRIENGNVEGIEPKLIVLMIGTNNANKQDNTAEEIADGIEAIVAMLRKRLPESKVLLLGVFPSGEKPNVKREKTTEVNRIVSHLDDGKAVFYLDIGPSFVAADQTISKEIMPDFLHLSPKGYDVWASSIEPKVAELLGEKAS